MEEIVEAARKNDGIPRTAQQSIPFDRMFPDGICRVGERYYTKTIDADKDKESGKSRNMLPLLLIPVILAAAGGGWFYVQTKKKKEAVNTPDPDADYTDDDDDEDYGAGEDDADGDDIAVVSDAGGDPYEDEILGDDSDDTEEA